MRTLFQELVDERQWQYPAFTAHFERAARELAEIEQNAKVGMLSVSQSTFERWCSGKTTPMKDARRVLTHMFGYSVEELFSPAPPSATRSVSVRAAIHRPTSHGADAHEMGRLTAMAAQRALRWAITAESNQLGPETVNHVHDEVQRIAQAYPRVALGTILNDLIEVQDLVFRLLESGQVKPNQARDLHFLASITSGMLAKASHDLGDPDSAMRQARAAYICADQADHQAMRAWVRGLQSLIAYWAGRPSDAAHYARSGTALTSPQQVGTVTVWLHSLQARAQSMLGDAEEARNGTRAADVARESVRSDELDAMGGLLTFPVVRQLYYTAETEVLGSNSAAAAESAQRAVDAYVAAAGTDEWAFGDEAGARTALALARIGADALDGVDEAMRPVLDLPAEKRLAGVVLSARRVHGALSAPSVRSAVPARALRAEIEAFSAASTRSLPG